MTIENSNAIIWRTSHLPGKIGPVIPGLRQILAGQAADQALSYEITDIAPTGERKNNEFFSETSAMWRVWKHGPTSEIIGWCHYRRYFWFGADTIDYTGYAADMDQQQFQKLLPNFIPHNLQYLSNENTFTVARVFNLEDGKQSIYDQYVYWHHGQDYLSYFCQIAVDYPYLSPFMADQFRSPQLYGCMMFICNWQTFDEFCNILFPSLDKWIDGRTRIHQNNYQNRAPSFLSERLFTAWVNWKKSQGWHINELPIVLLQDI